MDWICFAADRLYSRRRETEGATRGTSLNHLNAVLKHLFLMTVLICHIGCVSAGVGQVKQTRQRLNDLELGVSKTYIIKIMGLPRYRESFMDSDGQAIEVLFYQTEFVGEMIAPTEAALTPIVLKGDKVIGWGRTFLEQRIRITVDLAE